MTDLGILVLAEVLGIIQPIAAGSILAAGVVLALALGVVFVPEAAFAATVSAPPGFVPAPASLVAAAIAIRIRIRRSLATRGFVDAVVLAVMNKIRGAALVGALILAASLARILAVLVATRVDLGPGEV